MTAFFTLGQVAHRLSVPTHRIQYLLNSCKISEPSRIAGRRVWTDAEIEQIATQLACHGDKEVCNG